ncbi:MAG: hypothetical protein K0R36_2487 [Chryseobacterium sp.]|nr:hypothetical protein [Chryseobacterium sp.]
MKIEETSWENGSLKAPQSIYEFSLPEGDYSTQKKFVYKAKFNANVPYKLVDWRKGKTFKEKDSTTLKQEILNVYESLKKDFENQKGENYVNSLGSGLFNLYQSSYFEKEEALDHINHRISFINEKHRKLAEIENYKLQISEDGKLISLNRTDGFNKKEEGVLRRYYKKGIQEQVQVDDMILYAPKENA